MTIKQTLQSLSAIKNLDQGLAEPRPTDTTAVVTRQLSRRDSLNKGVKMAWASHQGLAEPHAPTGAEDSK